MHSQGLTVLLLICSLYFLGEKLEGATWNLSAEDHLEFERQLKVLNKPAVITLKTNYGELYDCVDFYKQPAFDHPLLKNYTVDYQLLHSSRHDESRDNSSVFLRKKRCPFGTVPIRRITKEDLIRERLATLDQDDDQPNSHYAVGRLQDGTKYDGAGADGNIVYTPPCIGQQWSSGRLKISNGPDSLEIGWRVDPTLYGDTLPHFYLRIDAGKTHCFDTRCPGFIVVDQTIDIGGAIESSVRGGQTLEYTLFLVRNLDNGNWNVEITEGRTLLGFWPKNLFTALSDGASSLEWGGEVFSPPDTPKPPMGAGFIPDGTNIGYDAFFRNPKRILGNAPNATLDAFDLKDFQDSNNYQVRFDSQRDSYFGNLVYYGGSHSPS